ncbi:autotransporter domain-containing protein [Pusillimonas caeni]|uniref:autotransporter family protein n=1 Tax=Pusillimonas caeni TaxID=1348472 RepID=UPI000E59C6F8|nr:autotransporter outer membrane beta-barrel domain-containing protein [Pusillimonas caeni]TFL11378.1 autotransporter domain-containing protein [Pusillimonas caeni]
MSGDKRQNKLLQITALSAALMGIYGTASAQTEPPPEPPTNTLLCKDTCEQPAANTDFYGKKIAPPWYEWIVKADNATLTLTGGTVTGIGNKTRGVGSTRGSTVTLTDVQVTTDTGGGSNWGSHGVQAQEANSTLNMIGGSISTTGEYSIGIQAGAGGEVTGTGVTISADGGTSHTFGIEANNGGKITLAGGSISVQGNNAGGARAYTGDGKTEKGEIDLDGTDIIVSGASAVGLMAGDKDDDTTTAGNITFKNAEVSVDGTNARAARAVEGGVLTIENATLTSNNASGNASGVFVDGAGSELNAKNLTIRSSGSAAAKGVIAETGGKVTIEGGSIETTGGMNSHAMDSYLSGSLIAATDVDVKTTGYAAGAFNGGEVVLTRGTFDVVGTTATEGWDTAAGFVAGGSAANSKLTANNVRLINSAPLLNAPPEYTSSALRVGADFGAPLASNATMTLIDSEVIASGPQRRIALVENSSRLVATNSRLVSEQDEGIRLSDNASLTLDGTTVETGKETLRSVFDNSGATQDITVKGNSILTKNDGTLLRVDRTGAGADGAVNLVLQSGAHASGNIRNYDDEGNLVDHTETFTTIDVQEGAIWAGIFIDPGTSVIDDDADLDDFTTGEGEDVAIEGSGSGTQNFNGTTNIGGSVSVGRDVAFNGPTSIGSDLNGQNNTSTTVQGPATIGGAINGGAGSSFTFNDTAGIGGDVGGAGGSSFSFNGATDIGGGAQGDGSSMTFSGPVNIGGAVSGRNGASFSFSTTESSNIGGGVNLDGGSSIGGGSTSNPINIGGDAFVGEGSTLGGNLNVAGSLSGTGGTFAPGNSIGTQTYGSMGDFTGTYVAEVNVAGQSDLITIASGNADLTGIDLLVSQENGNGGYKLDHDYTILRTEKADGISAVTDNRFASEALDDTFAGTLVKLDPVKYGAQDVKVSLSVDGDAIDRTGLSSNQSATLDGALSVAGRNASADAVMFMQPDARKDALNQLSGELHGSTQAALLQSSSLVSRTLTQRLRANLGAGMLPGAPTAQAGGAVAGAMPTSAAYPLWAQVVGNWNTLDSDGNAAKVKTNTAGLFIGGDAEVGAGWRVGGALGYTDGRVKVDERDSKSDVSTFTAALYGGNSWRQGTGTVNFLAGAAYSHHDIDSRRTVNVGGSQTLKADYRAHTTQLFTELGYAVPVGQRSVVEPYLGLAWLSQKAKGFTEEGGAAALQGESQKDDVTTFTLGLRGKTALNVGAHPAHLFAGLGWRHASGDVDPGRRVSFVQGGGAAFNVAGAPIAKNAAVLDLGVEMAVGRNTAMGLGYSGQYGNDNTDHSGQLYLRTRF